MNNKKLTDNEIKRAKELIEKLKKASNNYYNAGGDLPYGIGMTLNEAALWLEDNIKTINRLQEKNETLRNIVKQNHLVRNNGKSPLSLIKAEAYKEFFKLLNEQKEQLGYDPVYGAQEYVSIENVKKILEKLTNQ